MLAPLLYALRTLRRHPVYLALNGLGLGLALACCLLLYWFVRFHTSFEAGQPRADRIYRLVTELHYGGVEYQTGIPTPVGPALRHAHPEWPAVAMSIGQADQLIRVLDAAGRPGAKYAEPFAVAFAEPAYFRIFAYRWLAGRPDSALARPGTAVLTRRLARKYFGAANPLGRRLRLNQAVELTVTGLLADLPANTDQRYELFVSYATLRHYQHAGTPLDSWLGISSQTHGWVLLPPGTPARQLLRELTALHRAHYPATLRTHQYRVLPLLAQHFADQYDGAISQLTLRVLAGIGALLLLTAGLNFVNLATAQALGRGREIGVQRAVGATRRRVFWQFMLETLLLVLAAAGLGLVLAYTLLPWLREWTETPIPRWLDGPTWALLAGLVAALTLGAGWYPGRVLAGFQPARVLKGQAPSQARGGLGVRRALVLVQLALSQNFILAVLVMYQQLAVWLTADPGFATTGRVVLPTPTLPGADLPRLQAELLRVPGVAEVSFGYDSPLVGTNNSSYVHYTPRAGRDSLMLTRLAIDAQYLHLYQLPLVAGRDLPPGPGRTGYLVNEAAVRLLGAPSPQAVLGHALTLDNDPGSRTTAPIVGVVRDWRAHGFERAPLAAALFRNPGEYHAINLRLAPGADRRTLPAVQAVWGRHFPNDLFAADHLDEALAGYYAREKQQLTIVRLAAGTAVVISCLGLYGLLAFLARRRARELGIRRVLGARPEQLLAAFGRELAGLLLLAFAVAAPVAGWLLHRWLAQFATHIRLSAGLFGVGLAATAAVALLSTGLLAVRVARTPPARALQAK